MPPECSPIHDSSSHRFHRLQPSSSFPNREARANRETQSRSDCLLLLLLHQNNPFDPPCALNLASPRLVLPCLVSTLYPSHLSNSIYLLLRLQQERSPRSKTPINTRLSSPSSNFTPSRNSTLQRMYNRFSTRRQVQTSPSEPHSHAES